MRRLLGLRCAPLRSGRSMYRGRLVGLRVHVLRYRSIALVRGASRRLSILQKLQASLDVYVGWVEVGRALVCV